MSVKQETIHEESGLATYLTGFALSIGLLAVMMLFSSWMELYVVRRFAQNGTDSASLAAAGFYADSLSTPFPPVPYLNPLVASCPSVGVPTIEQVRDRIRREAVLAYQSYYTTYAFSAQGAALAEASSFASQNKNRHVASAFRVRIEAGRFSDLHHEHRDTGIILYPIRVWTETIRDYTSRTGQDQEVPGYASGTAFIDKVERPVDSPIPSTVIFDPQTGVPCTSWTVQYTYKWQVRLVDLE